ncbi:hypothetical protein [Sphingosinicella sp. BN140058]|uniref:hypothetical protein n=1 Tax=Sphingosinicella sp. BN140058 TaxID=1892855 RepID=UPI001011871B|nr:hypothetical protein [Sphingosinicella sp. BN140058]QAY76941.1 hypothetical protein ETR14_10870 [Sphingosinicella sp. BN140058]
MRILLPALALLLASCSTVAENRISSALTDAGLSEKVSECIAERMVDRLSWDQLRSLGRLSEERTKTKMNLAEFLHHYRGALDPEVYAVMTRAGVSCALTA